MASSKNLGNGIFEVVIAGMPLKLKSSRDPEVVHALITNVNKKIQEALTGTRSGSVQMATVLACLNLAEELFDLKSTAIRELDQFEKKAQRVLSELESSKLPRMGLEG